MRPKSIILLVLALGCGLVASIGINQVMANRGGGAVDSGETQTVVVAAADMNIYDEVTAAAVKLEPWPKDKVPAGAILTLEEIVGRRVRSKIWLGEPLLEAKLLQKGESAENPASLIPAGYRVVSVRVDAVSSSGNLIKPGDRVDVIVHLQQNSGRSISETTSKTFLQDVKVFAVNDIVSRDPGDGETRISAQTISLLVKPSDVELVTLASEMGRIRLSMRGPSDDKPVDTTGVVANELLGNVGESNREEDEPRPDNLSNPANDLLGMLNQQPQAVVEPVVVAKPTHTMTLLLGARVEEIELEEGSMVSRSKASSGVVTPAAPAVTEAIVNPPVTESPDTVSPDNASPDAASRNAAGSNQH